MDSVFKIGFHNVDIENHTKNGRIDTVITEKSRIFIIEYKCREKSSSKALKQIIDKEYYAKYLSKNLPILLFGITLVKDKSTTTCINISYDIKNNKNK